jgi:hypothetical protein
MKQHPYLTCLFWMVFSVNASAQLKKIHSDPVLAKKFATVAEKNREYASMRSQLTALIKSASPRNTNATAVRNLLVKNSGILKDIYNRAGIDAPRVMQANTKRGPKMVSINSSIPGMSAKFKPLNPLFKTFTPPYGGKMVSVSSIAMEPDTTLSNYAAGKIALTYTSDDWGEEDWIGFNLNAFERETTVPDNPLVVAAEIKFEYSYLYTGWDTHGSVRALKAVVRTQGLQDEQYVGMDTLKFPSGSVFPPYRVALDIQPMDSIEVAFDDFIVSGSDSLVLQRYVTPGETFLIEFGLGFPNGTRRGVNGCYHYAEMILKKITIRYFKAGEN